MFELIDMIIVRPIVNILFVIYSAVGDFGLAIILFTLLVKFAMWPLMKRQLHQTRIMREIQPELAQIKKNCKGNRQLESLQMMDLYKRKNVKPFRSILTVFIQLPIFIALFTAINVAVRPMNMAHGNREYNVEHSAYFYIEDLNNVKELIDKQRAYLTALDTDENAKYEFEPKLFGIVNLSAQAGFTSKSSIAILIFALISAVMQFIMARQQDPMRKNGKKGRTMRDILREAKDGKEADQDEVNAIAQSQMTFMMPLMMLFIMFNLPGAVVLYYMLNNCITVALQKFLLNRNYTEMEAAADKKIISENSAKDKIINAQEAEIIEKDAEIDRLKQQTHFSSNTNKNKNEKVHITRIKASDKKKRR